MPEGDTIHRIAAALKEALEGHVVDALELPRSAHSTSHLRGRRVERVEARGKNLLVHFGEGSVLHTHLQMNGSWHLYRSGERWQRSRAAARVILSANGWTAVCFNAPVVRLLSAGRFRLDRSLRLLGPDPLRPEEFDADEARARLRQRHDTEIAVALLDQRALAGIGNVFKSELLFNLKIDPFAPVSALSDDELVGVVDHAAELLRANVSERLPIGHGPSAHLTYTRTTRPTPRPRPRGMNLRGSTLTARSVYGREGLACHDCGTRILRAVQGTQRRSTYWCPKCQPARRTT